MKGKTLFFEIKFIEKKKNKLIKLFSLLKVPILVVKSQL
jgi:hypothetical protein